MWGDIFSGAAKAVGAFLGGSSGGGSSAGGASTQQAQPENKTIEDTLMGIRKMHSEAAPVRSAKTEDITTQSEMNQLAKYFFDLTKRMDA